MESILKYLEALADPKALIDHDRSTKLETQVQTSEDPLARVKLRAELASVLRADLSDLEDAFIRDVPEWVREQGLSVEDARAALLAEGVSADVLERIWTC